MLLVVDNYDSFTYNLVQYLSELGANCVVHRNDEIDVAQIKAVAPQAILISPGPCSPDEAGISLDVVATFAGQVPLLGVCLGHQCIAQQYGGTVIHAPKLMHGKTSQVFHSGESIFSGIENPFVATRYHSLVVERQTLPESLKVLAKTWEDDIMGIAVKTTDQRAAPCVGVQFHPESIMTAAGKGILKNFLGEVDAFWSQR